MGINACILCRGGYNFDYHVLINFSREKIAIKDYNFLFSFWQQDYVVRATETKGNTLNEIILS